MKKMALRSKLVLGGITIVLIPLVIMGIFSVRETSLALESFFRQQTVNTARSLADMVRTFITGEIKFVEELSIGMTTLRAGTKVTEVGVDHASEEIDQVNQKLSRVMELTGGNYEFIFMADASGTVYADSNGGKARGVFLGNREYFRIAKEGRTNVSNVMESEDSGAPIVIVCTPVFSETKKFVGIVAAALKITVLQKKIASLRLGETGYAFMVDQTGQVIAHLREELIFKTNIKDAKGMEKIAEEALN